MSKKVRDSFRIEIRKIGRDHQNRIYPKVKVRPKNGNSVSLIRALEELNADSPAIFSAAAQAGIPLITRRRKERFRHALERALDRMKDLNSRSDFDVATRTGWHESRQIVTPWKVYGSRARELIPALNDPDLTDQWTPSGTLGDWKQMAKRVGRKNPLLIFSACTAFVPPLLELLRMEGFGIMVVGGTSIGKTTASFFAASVWRGFIDNLYTTTNNLERVAAQVRDCLLVPDDTKRVEGGLGTKRGAENLAQEIFVLVGGTGKGRLTSQALPADWRLVFWLTSNQTTQQILEGAGLEFDPSYSVRLVEISGERRYGVFDHVPHGMSRDEFAKWIKDQARQVHGAPIDKFLEHLVAKVGKDRGKLIRWLEERQISLRKALHIDENDGKEARIASIFGAIYAAGCLARRAGVLPWHRSEIKKSIIEMNRARSAFTEGDRADHDYVEQIRGYIDRKRSRFIDVRQGPTSVGDDNIGTVPGFITEVSGRMEYCFWPRSFKKQFGQAGGIRPVIRALKDADLLIHDKGKAKSQGKDQTKRRIRKEKDRDRVYCVDAAILNKR